MRTATVLAPSDEHGYLEAMTGPEVDCYDRTVAVLIQGRGCIDKWVLYGVINPDPREGDEGDKRILQAGRWYDIDDMNRERAQFGGCELHHDEKQRADEAFREKEGWG